MEKRKKRTEEWFAVMSTHGGIMSIHESKSSAKEARSMLKESKKHRILSVDITYEK